MKSFKFFQGEERVFSEYMDRTDDYFLGGRPPIGLDISNRHWNILPQDIREMSSVEIMAYIEGWESPQVGNVYNPYPDNFRLGNIWTRGWSHRQRRNHPRQTLQPTDIEYYNTEDFIFFDVSETRYDEDTYVPYKVMLFRHIEEGNTVEGDRIDYTHPMYNFPDIL